MKKITANDIDAILPQTQCGLCRYEGCMPYAEALANGKASIDLCPPGGIDGLLAIGELLNIDPSPYLQSMTEKAKPAMRAVIREAECIGCTKCIKACPVDAIIGSGKLMHTVITDECTGCELCIAPCPVDCIDMVPATEPTLEKRNHFRKRYFARQRRLDLSTRSETTLQALSIPIENKKNYIQEALLRTKAKKTP